MNKYIKFLKLYHLNILDAIILTDILLIFTYGNGGFTNARFYLFLPFAFTVLLFYGLIRVMFYLFDGFKKVMNEEEEIGL